MCYKSDYLSIEWLCFSNQEPMGINISKVLQSLLEFSNSQKYKEEKSE